METFDETVNDERPTVVYCLFTGCNQTRWLAFTRWEISLDRERGMETGEYQAISGPFCPDHSIGEG